MKKVTIIVLHLGYGGIEKATASLANMLCETYDVRIICTYKLFEKPAFFVDEKVKINYLINHGPNKQEFLKNVKSLYIIAVLKEGIKSIKTLYLKKSRMIDAVKQLDTDVIISTRAFHNRIVGSFGNSQTLKIAWEHSHHNDNKKYISNLIQSCKGMDYLITVSKELRDYYKKYLGDSKCKHISLALDYYPLKSADLKSKEITTIGRLSKEKGFIDLLDVFKLVHIKHPDWHLNIVGDGEEKEKIKSKIIADQLETCVTMHGFKITEEIHNLLDKTSIFAMASFTESFGLVFIEAMSHGIPCIAFDSARGPLEIIRDNMNGFIVKNRNKEEMANKIIDLIENEDVRIAMGQEALKDSREYNKDKIKEEWIKLIEQKEYIKYE